MTALRGELRGGRRIERLLKTNQAWARWVAGCLVLSLAAKAGLGQKKESPAPQTAAAPASAPEKRVAKDIVLTVSVIDKSGKPVAGLVPENLTLEQDRGPQVIKKVSSAKSLPLRLGLLYDTDRGEAGSLDAAKEAGGKFVDQMLEAPSDRAFLLHFDRQVELIEDLTNSRDKLHRELDEMTASKQALDSEPEGTDSGGQRGAKRNGGGPHIYDAIYLTSTEVLDKKAGRNAVVLISDGLDRGSKETMNEAIDSAERAGVPVFTIYVKSEEEGKQSIFSRGEGDGRQGGGGYPGGGGGYPGGGAGYPGGGRRGGQPRPGGGSGEQKGDGKKVLEQISMKTGGRFFEARKRENFAEIFNAIGEELKGEYLVTYTPDKPPSKDDSDGFHKVILKAKDEKWSVAVPEGFFVTD